MENQKNNKGVIVLLVVIIVILSVLCILFATRTIDFKSKDASDNEIKENINDNNAGSNDDNSNVINNTKDEIIKKYFYDVNDLSVKALPEYQIFADISKNSNVVETVDFGFEKDYRADLDISGNVNVLKYGKSENEKNISGKLNVTGVIDIIQFNLPSMESNQLLYLLTDDGNVYYYRIGDVENNNFNVTKVENVSNVKKLFISSFSKVNAGGSWALFAITDNDDCIMIIGESV